MPKPNRANQARTWTDYTGRFRERVLPALLKSAYAVKLAEPFDPKDPNIQAATELGLLLLLDKPLILIIPPGLTVPSALRRAAAITLDDFDVTDPASQERITEVVGRLNEGTVS